MWGQNVQIVQKLQRLCLKMRVQGAVGQVVDLSQEEYQVKSPLLQGTPF